MADVAFSEVHHRDVRLSYADCDPSGILYFSTWFPLMESVQTEWLFLKGLRQDTLTERFGFGTLTRSTECEYLVPTRLFEVIRVSMAPTHVGNSSCLFEYRMTRIEDASLVARGRLTLVTVDSEGIPTRVPEPLRGLLSRAGKRN